MKTYTNITRCVDACGIDVSGCAALHANLGAAALCEFIVTSGEGRLSVDGAIVVDTGQHTGRSPKDKFVVRDPDTEGSVCWDNNGAIARDTFGRLREDMLAHAEGRQLFAQDLYAGADPAHRIRVRVFTEFAWHSLFIRNLLIRPPPTDLAEFRPDLTIVDLPSFKAVPGRYGVRSETVIACDLTNRLVLIGGTSYAGEMKKAVFTYLNFALPEAGVLPMHCSANVGQDGRSAVFFGLSGTGKTTLSATSDRTLIGDDEHGWGETGVFNLEGGCYAKTVRLSREAEPQIYAAAHRFGTVLENVTIDTETRVPDFKDDQRTENTRAAYPLHFVDNASSSGRAGHPAAVVLLTADAFGVLPPIAKLTPEQAVYHFLSGFTAKVAGTEKGVTEPQPTFSACFGAPFMPRHPAEYAGLLLKAIERNGSACWLVNTGWTGGAFGTGTRMPIAVTRRLLAAAIDGELDAADFRTEKNFGFRVPTVVEGVDTGILDPRSTWADDGAYDIQAAKLGAMFRRNFERFESHVDATVRNAAPPLTSGTE